MPSLLVKVKKKMSIYAQRRVRSVLDGEYGSVFKGRSIDFDDLRAYSFGDDIKDVDWRATARNGEMLVKRYVAVRKHNIMLVGDIGNSMAALANPKETKKDVALLAAGIIAYIAQRHGDLVGLVAGDSQRIRRFPLKEDTAHLENLLKTYSKSMSISAPESSLTAILTYISRNFRERMMLVVITDATGASGVPEELLKRLAVRHEQMFIIAKDATVTDADFATCEVRDIAREEAILPRFIRSSKKLAMAEAKLNAGIYDGLDKRLKQRGISSVAIGSEAEAVAQIARLMERQKNVRRR